MAIDLHIRSHLFQKRVAGEPAAFYNYSKKTQVHLKTPGMHQIIQEVVLVSTLSSVHLVTILFLVFAPTGALLGNVVQVGFALLLLPVPLFLFLPVLLLFQR